MNIQEYISGGIIESYVLGIASAEERSEFESMCRQYPEVLRARIAFELVLEKQAQENAIEPPPDLKKRIAGQINQTGKLINITSFPAKKTLLKYAVAASLVLLAGSIYWNIYLQKENKKVRSALNDSKNELVQVQQDMKVIMGNPALKMASMKGMPVSPQSYTTVYWDSTTHDVYLMVNNLPEPPSDKQYQIWALLNGQPIDLGLIDNTYFVKQSTLLVKAKNVQNAQAFAITLETKGGNPTPKGDMYVMGNL